MTNIYFEPTFGPVILNISRLKTWLKQLIVTLPRIIAENTATDAQWREDSFVGTLHETQQWSHEKYAELEGVWLGLVAPDRDQSTDDAAFAFFDYLTLLFCCHFDPSDGFAFANLSAEQIYAYRDRIRSVFDAYFARELTRLVPLEITTNDTDG